MSSPFKPSTLAGSLSPRGSGSNGRASPFRRPESPSSPSTTSMRPSTPTRENTYRPSTPSRLGQSWSGGEPQALPSSERPGSRSGVSTGSPTKHTRDPSHSSVDNSYDLSGKSTGSANKSTGSTIQAASPRETFTQTQPRSLPLGSKTAAYGGTDALSRLPPAQTKELREAFSLLDRSSTNSADKSDVAEILSQLGLPSDPAHVAQYFPASTPHPLPLPHFMNALAGSLAPLSPPQELLAAMAAFDDDDSGQVDVAELVDALVNVGGGSGGGCGGRGLTREEAREAMESFVGRRAFDGRVGHGGLGKGRAGDVFKYREWVASLGPVENGAKTKRVETA